MSDETVSDGDGVSVTTQLCPECGASMDLDGRSVNARWVCPFDSQIVWAVEHRFREP